jgi:gas vesicle protein
MLFTPALSLVCSSALIVNPKQPIESTRRYEMSDNSGGEIGAFFAGFLVGGLVGAAAALLLAPQSGEETRGQIRQKGIELQTRAEDAMDEARAKVDAVAADVKRRAEELQLQSKVILEEGQKQLTSAVEETKKAASTVKKGKAKKKEAKAKSS